MTREVPYGAIVSSQGVPRNPLGDSADTDPDDLELTRRVRSGSQQALEELVTRHQGWISLDHPFQRSPDFVAALRALMNQPTFRSLAAGQP